MPNSADLAKAHLLAAQNDEALRKQMQSVVIGQFTSKRGDGGKVTVSGPSLTALEANVRRFYAEAGKLKETNEQRGPVTLYRAVMMDADQRNATEFLERIPTSTSHDLEFAKSWTANRGGGQNYVIFEINAPGEHDKMVLSYPGGYQRQETDPREMNGEQQEVTLAPSRFTVTGRRFDGDVEILMVDAKQLSVEEAVEAMRDQSPSMTTADAYGHFSRFFGSEQTLRTAYDYDMPDATVVASAETTQGNVRSRTFTISRPNSVENLVVNIEHDADADNVRLKIGDTDYVYGPDNMNQVASYLRFQNLHEFESFEYLDMPETWTNPAPPPPAAAQSWRPLPPAARKLQREISRLGSQLAQTPAPTDTEREAYPHIYNAGYDNARAELLARKAALDSELGKVLPQNESALRQVVKSEKDAVFQVEIDGGQFPPQRWERLAEDAAYAEALDNGVSTLSAHFNDLNRVETSILRLEERKADLDQRLSVRRGRNLQSRESSQMLLTSLNLTPEQTDTLRILAELRGIDEKLATLDPDSPAARELEDQYEQLATFVTAQAVQPDAELDDIAMAVPAALGADELKRAIDDLDYLADPEAPPKLTNALNQATEELDRAYALRATMLEQLAPPPAPPGQPQQSSAQNATSAAAAASPGAAGTQLNTLLTDLKTRLPQMSARNRSAALEYLPAVGREQLASDPQFVDDLRAALTPQDFAQTAAQLLVQVPPGVSQPISARHEAEAQVARMLQDPDAAAKLLKDGSRVVVVPKDTPMTALPQFNYLANQQTFDGRTWEFVRGSGGVNAAITEENLVGEHNTVTVQQPAYEDGYSTTTHEFAHTLHEYGLSAGDKQLIEKAFTDKWTRTGQPPYAEQWPDGPLHDTASKPAHNYGSMNVKEYFAQASNAYLGTNTGTDPYTGQPRNNGPEWVRQHEPDLLPLLERLYGSDPRAIHSAPANPVNQTQAEKDLYAGYRSFMVQSGARTPTSSQNTSRDTSQSNSRNNSAPGSPSLRATNAPAPPLEYGGVRVKSVDDLAKIGADKENFFNKSVAAWKKAFDGKKPTDLQKNKFMAENFEALKALIDDPVYQAKANTPQQLKEMVNTYRVELAKLELMTRNAQQEIARGQVAQGDSGRQFSDAAVQSVHDDLHQAKAFPDNELADVARKAVESQTKAGYQYELRLARDEIEQAPQGSRVQLGALPPDAVKAYLGDDAVVPGLEGMRNKLVGADVVIWKPLGDGQFGADFIQAKSVLPATAPQKVEEAANQLAGLMANPKREHTSAQGEFTLQGEGFRGVIRVELAGDVNNEGPLSNAANKALTRPEVHEVRYDYYDASTKDRKFLRFTKDESQTNAPPSVASVASMQSSQLPQNYQPAPASTSTLPAANSSSTQAKAAVL